MNIDIHNYPKKLKRELDYLEKISISKKNKGLIKTFYEDCILQGISKPRIVKLLEVVRNLALFLKKDFDKADIDDIKRIVCFFDEKEWSPWTKATYRAILKKFFKWLNGNEEYPKEVKWIRSSLKSKDVKILNTQDLITEEEVTKAIRASDHPRNKAFIAIIAESGCRIGEIGTLCLKNIAFDQHGTVLNLHGKTGSRRVRVINATTYLTTWLNCHPFKDDPEAPLWVNVGSCNYHKPMRYNALARILKDAFRSAGIKKRCNPHLFRHSRASILANHLTEFQMNQYFGWIQGSDMPSTYVHLSGRDLDSAILKMNGLVVEEKKQQESPKKCPRCDSINAKDNVYCSKCAAILDEKTKLQSQKQFLQEQNSTNNVNTLMTQLMKDSDVQKLLAEKILALGLKEKLV